MLKHLYRLAIRLHPSDFRKRFGDEMLYIFDQQEKTPALFGLVLDSLFSLLRQWASRPQEEIIGSCAPLPEPPSNGVPSFLTLTSFRPPISALVDGMVLSLILFCMTGFAIRYSWIHILNVHIREISFDLREDIHPTATRPGYSVASSVQPIRADSEKSDLVSEHLQVDVVAVEPESATGISTITSTKPRAALGQSPEATLWLRLELYVGKYISSSPRLKISIKIDGNHLSLDIAGQPRRALSPVSQTKFLIAGGGNGWVEFSPDQQGSIRSLCLNEGGNVITAQRQ